MKRIVLGVLLFTAWGLAAIASGQSADQLSDDGSRRGKKSDDDDDKKPDGKGRKSDDKMERMGMDHMHRWMKERRMKSDAMSMMGMQSDALGMMHMKFQQMHGKIPVFGAEVIVHMMPDGRLAGMTDNCAPGGMQLEKKTEISKREALELATKHYGCDDCFTKKPKLDKWVMRHGEEDRLVYRVQLFREDGSAETAMPVVFIDAHDGSVVMAYDNMQSATGTGFSLYSGNVSLETLLSGSTYYLEDVTRRLGTLNYSNTTGALSRFSDPNNVWDAAVQRAAVDAHFGAAKFFDYFQSTHGRNGIDGAGGPFSLNSVTGVSLVTSRVHYSNSYNNAFWNGQYMTYGDGDGVSFSPLVSLDFVGHEMTHGITERTARLVYSGESGALNESISDVFGAMVERYSRGESANTWRIGEDIYSPNTLGDALRYLDTPHSAANSGFTGDDDPDHYNERYKGSSDNGGVHINSGIGNKAFHLLAKGGTHHLGGSMTGIGADPAARIWYVALTSYMTSSTNFAGARLATLNAASALYGAQSAQYAAVGQAWCLVGVGCTPPPPPGGGPNLLSNGAFESTVMPWVPSGTGALYVANGTAHGGTGYIYFGSAANQSGQTYQQFSIPAAAATANLSFWLNVTSAEATTPIQYDRLFVEVRDAAGNLLSTLATYSNVDKVAAATAYSLKGSFSLLAYKGQTIRIQFRSTNDSIAVTTFRVDDVAVN